MDGQTAEMEFPLVPHLLVQRIDALPESAMGYLLRQLEPQASVRGGGSWRGPSGRDASGKDAPKDLTEQVRKLVEQRRLVEVPQDADSVDFSSELFDNIPRQMELQWRTYAKLHPDEVAAAEKLKSLLGAQDHEEYGPGPVNRRALDKGSQAPGPFNWVTRVFGGVTAGVPSAGELQRSLQRLTPSFAPPPIGSWEASSSFAQPGSASESPSPATLSIGASSAAAAAAVAGPSASITGEEPRGLRLAKQSSSPSRRMDYVRDPIFQQIRTSLDAWYALHDGGRRPLRSGHVARVHALFCPEMPDTWTSSMTLEVTGGGARRRVTSGPAGLALQPLRWAAGAANTAGGLLGLRRRPRVWEVPAEAGCAEASTGQGLEQQRAGVREGAVVRGATATGGAASVVAGGSTGSTGGGIAPARSYRGLAAAQEAALRGQFALRKMTLLPLEWL